MNDTEKLPAENGVRASRILLSQSLGFLAIILVCLVDEVVGLSELVLGDRSYIIDFHDSALKVLLIFCVWLLVSGSTRRVLVRTQRLEKFMLVCAWCRRIKLNGRWLPLEEFLHLGFQKPTSHGICEDCASKAAAEIPNCPAAVASGHLVIGAAEVSERFRASSP